MPLDRRRKLTTRAGDEPVVKPLSAAERLQLANLTTHPLADPLDDADEVLGRPTDNENIGDADQDPAAEADEDIGASRDKLYRQHIFSAHHFAQSAEDIEGRDGGDGRGGGDGRDAPQEEKWRHRAYVTGAVMTSAAFLEASINELYRELQNLTQSGERRLPPRQLAVLTRVWPEIAGSAILHKYQVALSLADADSYDESRPPFADAESLIRLRDALLSCSPDWDDSRGKHHTLEKRLRTKFPPNSLAAPDAPWFPDRCLGVGCAKWSVRIAHLFSDDFCHRMGIPVRARVGSEGAA